MSFASYSTTASANVTIEGQSIGEGTTNPGTVNFALRYILAYGKELSDTVAAIDISSKANLNAPAFTGQPTYSGRGAFLHHQNSANASGRIYVQADGAATPTLSNGDILMVY